MYFEEGNRLFEQANRARAAQRTELLQRSLEAYVDSLRIVRSRNALFNAAIVLGELGRNDEAFNYFSEYLAIEGLTEADRENASARRDALRTEVAVLQVTSEPEGALLWVDRKDLAPRGETPIELALPPGEHRAFVEKEGFEPVERTQTMVRGVTTVLALALLPVAVEPVNRTCRSRCPSLWRSLRAHGFATRPSGRRRAPWPRPVSRLACRCTRAACETTTTRPPRSTRSPATRRTTSARRTSPTRPTASTSPPTCSGGRRLASVSARLCSTGCTAKSRSGRAPDVAVSVSRHGGFASIRVPIGARP